MNIMHVLGNFGPGGAEMGVVRLVNALQQEHTTHCVCSIGPDLRMKDRLENGARCYSLNVEGSCRTAFLKLTQLISSTKINILHVNNLGPWFDASLAAKISGCKCIETFHGTESNLERYPISRRLLWKIADKWTTSINAVSTSGLDLFLRITGINKYKVKFIPNGVDTERFRPCPVGGYKLRLRKDLGLPENGILFGCVAALRPVKNHEGMISAFAELIHRDNFNTEVYLLIVGDGVLENRLKTLCREEGVGSQTIFMGQRGDVPDILRTLDGFLLNSKTEGMSYAILEAMASGVPIIATDVGGNAELVSHGEEGFLYPEGDTDALTDHIKSVVENRELLKIMGEKARRKVCNLYSLDKMVKAYQKLYEEVYNS